MKILHLSPLYPPHIGGLESHAAQFDEQMTSVGASITVFTPRLPRNAPGYEQKRPSLTVFRYPVIELIPNYPLPAFWQWVFWQQLRQISRLRYDLIISRTRFFSSSLLAMLISKVWHLPWLHIEHGSDFVSLGNPLWRWLALSYDNTIGRLVLGTADSLVANSRASARFVWHLAHRRALVIYRGIEHKHIAAIPPDTAIRRRFPNCLLITFIGRLIDGKGVADLISAIDQLTAKYPARRRDPAIGGDQLHTRIHCLIIGDGPQRHNLSRLVQDLNLMPHVTFLGQQPYDRTIAILKSSDIFVNPSHTEGLPTTVIEAALCRVAIVATNIGGTPEIVTSPSSSILIPPKQPQKLAHELAILIGNAASRRLLAERAFSEVSPKFSWHASMAAYQTLFRELIRGATLE